MKQSKGLEITTLILIIVGFVLIFFGIDSRVRNVEKLVNQIDKTKIIEKYYNNTDTTIIERYFDSFIEHTDTTIFKSNEYHYFHNDSLVKIKYLNGQVVFPVTTFVMIGYDIDSFKQSCLMGLRDQIDSIFNIRFNE